MLLGISPGQFGRHGDGDRLGRSDINVQISTVVAGPINTAGMKRGRIKNRRFVAGLYPVEAARRQRECTRAEETKHRRQHACSSHDLYFSASYFEATVEDSPRYVGR